jgi:hypothetical protein
MPDRQELSQSIMLGYPQNLFSGGSLIGVNKSPSIGSDGGEQYVGFESASTNGASGGALLIDGKLSGVIKGAKQLDYDTVIQFATIFRETHRPLLREASCMARRLPRTCRS